MNVLFGFFGFIGWVCWLYEPVCHHECLSDSGCIGLVIAGILSRSEILRQSCFNFLLFGLSVTCYLFLDCIRSQLIPLMVNAPDNPVRHARHFCLADHCLRKCAERGFLANKIGRYAVLFNIGKEKGHGFQNFIQLLAMGFCFGFIVDVGCLKIREHKTVIRFFNGYFAKSRSFLTLIC